MAAQSRHLTRIYERARAAAKRIVLPEAFADERTAHATAMLLREGWAKPLLLGSRAEVDKRGDALGIDLRAAECVPMKDEAILSRVSRSLAISLAAGMPMIQTLNIIARAAGNDFMAERILRLRDAVERGDPLSRAAATAGMFPPLVLQMMSVGEETGELSQLMDEVADFYQREVDYALKNLSAMLEPLLIVGVGVAVLILALGVFLPMWNMIAKVGAGH